MTDRTVLTPVLQSVFAALARSPEPHTYASLSRVLGKPEQGLHRLVADLRDALVGADVAVCPRRFSRGGRIHFVVTGKPEAIARIISATPAEGLPSGRYVKAVTLPSILGLSYEYTPEGRLSVDGQLQPVRAA